MRGREEGGRGRGRKGGREKQQIPPAVDFPQVPLVINTNPPPLPRQYSLTPLPTPIPHVPVSFTNVQFFFKFTIHSFTHSFNHHLVNFSKPSGKKNDDEGA